MVNPISNMSNEDLLEEYNFRHSEYMDYYWRNDTINWSPEAEEEIWQELQEVKNEILKRMGEDI